MNTFDQLKTGCWLFNHSAFRMRSKKRLEDEILNGQGLFVEGLYTKQNEAGRFNGKDVFDGKMATLAIDGQFIQGIFHKMGEVKTYFYSNDNHIPAMISLMQIGFDEKKNLSILEPLGDVSNPKSRYGPKYQLYTFCVNAVLDELDMMAAKLVSD